MRKDRRLTRAEDLGVSTRKLRQFCHVRIRRIDRDLVDIAGQFGGVDHAICNLVDDLRAQLSSFSKEVGSSCAWLDLPVGEEPE